MKHLPLATLLALISAPAMAYVGPGLGMGVIGTIFGVLAAIVLAVFGLFWYPLKRRFGKKKADVATPQTGSYGDRSVQIAQPDSTAHTGNVSSADTHSQNHATSPSAALNATPESATVNRTDSPVR